MTRPSFKLPGLRADLDLQGASIRGADFDWQSGVTYANGDMVIQGGNLFRSAGTTITGNITVTPTGATTGTLMFTAANITDDVNGASNTFSGIFPIGTNFVVGATTYTLTSVADLSGTTPATVSVAAPPLLPVTNAAFTAFSNLNSNPTVSPQFWSAVSSFRSEWQPNTFYQVDDVFFTDATPATDTNQNSLFRVATAYTSGGIYRNAFDNTLSALMGLETGNLQPIGGGSGGGTTIAANSSSPVTTNLTNVNIDGVVYDPLSLPRDDATTTCYSAQVTVTRGTTDLIAADAFNMVGVRVTSGTANDTVELIRDGTNVFASSDIATGFGVGAVFTVEAADDDRLNITNNVTVASAPVITTGTDAGRIQFTTTKFPSGFTYSSTTNTNDTVTSPTGLMATTATRTNSWKEPRLTQDQVVDYRRLPVPPDAVGTRQQEEAFGWSSDNNYTLNTLDPNVAQELAISFPFPDSGDKESPLLLQNTMEYTADVSADGLFTGGSGEGYGRVVAQSSIPRSYTQLPNAERRPHYVAFATAATNNQNRTIRIYRRVGDGAYAEDGVIDASSAAGLSALIAANSDLTPVNFGNALAIQVPLTGEPALAVGASATPSTSVNQRGRVIMFRRQATATGTADRWMAMNIISTGHNGFSQNFTVSTNNGSGVDPNTYVNSDFGASVAMDEDLDVVIGNPARFGGRVYKANYRGSDAWDNGTELATSPDANNRWYEVIRNTGQTAGIGSGTTNRSGLLFATEADALFAAEIFFRTVGLTNISSATRPSNVSSFDVDTTYNITATSLTYNSPFNNSGWAPNVTGGTGTTRMTLTFEDTGGGIKNAMVFRPGTGYSLSGFPTNSAGNQFFFARSNSNALVSTLGASVAVSRYNSLVDVNRGIGYRRPFSFTLNSGISGSTQGAIAIGSLMYTDNGDAVPPNTVIPQGEVFHLGGGLLLENPSDITVQNIGTTSIQLGSGQTVNSRILGGATLSGNINSGTRIESNPRFMVAGDARTSVSGRTEHGTAFLYVRDDGASNSTASTYSIVREALVENSLLGRNFSAELSMDIASGSGTTTVSFRNARIDGAPVTSNNPASITSGTSFTLTPDDNSSDITFNITSADFNLTSPTGSFTATRTTSGSFDAGEGFNFASLETLTHYGASVDISHGRVVVGAPGDTNGNTPGAAFAFPVYARPLTNGRLPSTAATRLEPSVNLPYVKFEQVEPLQLSQAITSLTVPTALAGGNTDIVLTSTAAFANADLNALAAGKTIEFTYVHTGTTANITYEAIIQATPTALSNTNLSIVVRVGAITVKGDSTAFPSAQRSSTALGGTVFGFNLGVNRFIFATDELGDDTFNVISSTISGTLNAAGDTLTISNSNGVSGVTRFTVQIGNTNSNHHWDASSGDINVIRRSVSVPRGNTNINLEVIDIEAATAGQSISIVGTVPPENDKSFAMTPDFSGSQFGQDVAIFYDPRDRVSFPNNQPTSDSSVRTSRHGGVGSILVGSPTARDLRNNITGNVWTWEVRSHLANLTSTTDNVYIPHGNLDNNENQVNQNYGISVHLSGLHALVGSNTYDDPSATGTDHGKVYRFNGQSVFPVLQVTVNPSDLGAVVDDGDPLTLDDTRRVIVVSTAPFANTSDPFVTSSNDIIARLNNVTDGFGQDDNTNRLTVRLETTQSITTTSPGNSLQVTPGSYVRFVHTSGVTYVRRRVGAGNGTLMPPTGSTTLAGYATNQANISTLVSSADWQLVAPQNVPFLSDINVRTYVISNDIARVVNTFGDNISGSISYSANTLQSTNADILRDFGTLEGLGFRHQQIDATGTIRQASVIRWGNRLLQSAPSFRPILNANNTVVRTVALETDSTTQVNIRFDHDNGAAEHFVARWTAIGGANTHIAFFNGTNKVTEINAATITSVAQIPGANRTVRIIGTGLGVSPAINNTATTFSDIRVNMGTIALSTDGTEFGVWDRTRAKVGNIIQSVTGANRRHYKVLVARQGGADGTDRTELIAAEVVGANPVSATPFNSETANYHRFLRGTGDATGESTASKDEFFRWFHANWQNDNSGIGNLNDKFSGSTLLNGTDTNNGLITTDITDDAQGIRFDFANDNDLARSPLFVDHGPLTGANFGTMVWVIDPSQYSPNPPASSTDPDLRVYATDVAIGKVNPGNADPTIDTVGVFAPLGGSRAWIPALVGANPTDQFFRTIADQDWLADRAREAVPQGWFTYVTGLKTSVTGSFTVGSTTYNWREVQLYGPSIGINVPSMISYYTIRITSGDTNFPRHRLIVTSSRPPTGTATADFINGITIQRRIGT